ncbi:MAG: OPT/YSL family transporter, partial [Deltaproteobacteria bacterium]|nr:OPT/YSL family transporter [Deltaproteobacteria bacterium]
MANTDNNSTASEAPEQLHSPEPGERQLTARAIIFGCLLGGLVSAMNISFGLKIGWTVGGSLMAAILGYAAFTIANAAPPGLIKLLLVLQIVIGTGACAAITLSAGLGLPLVAGVTSLALVVSVVLAWVLWKVYPGQPSVLETNITQTTGSAAGTMASAGGLVAPIPAMLMLGYEIPLWGMFAWVASVAFLGVFFAVPLRRQYVDIEKLRFPTGTATANTIVSMFAKGAEAMQKAKVLVWVAIGSGAYALASYFV